MNVIVYHPAQQHSYHTAAAVKKQNMLLRYITAIYDKHGSIGMSLARIIVRGNDSARLSNRRCSDLDDVDVRLFATIPSLAVIILSRFSLTKRLSFRLDRLLSKYIGKKAAKYALHYNADAVICFSSNARSCFEYLQKRQPKIKRIIDCASAPIAYMREIYEEDIAKTGDNSLRQEVPSFFSDKVLQNEQRELALSDCFIVPSQFVAKGLRFCGVPKNKFEIIPYGSNFPLREKPQTVPVQIRFIYVGKISRRKGTHYLFRAFRELNYENVILDAVGELRNDALHEEYADCPNIRFWGHLSHDKVREMMISSNVFVFASLTEGLSLACIEALACGLPVICSENSGANDMIRSGENGFVFKPDDVDSLKRFILFFCNNKELLPKFSQAALDTASQYSWDRYEKGLQKLLCKISSSEEDEA